MTTTQPIQITRTLAQKVLTTVDAGLVRGLGEPRPGEFCVEAAVCYALGLPHSDDPGCVSAAVRALKIRLNDSNWSSPTARAAGLRRLALVQLGTLGAVDDKEFARRVVEFTIRTMVPIALRVAAARQKDSTHRDALLKAADRCEAEGTRESILEARNAASAAAYAAYASAASAAAAAADAAYASAAAAARDSTLAAFAEGVVQILVDMQAPGVQWLDLAPLGTGATHAD